MNTFNFFKNMWRKIIISRMSKFEISNKIVKIEEGFTNHGISGR